jgi:hypothetical protein
MLRVGFVSNCEYGIPGCGMDWRERVVAGCPELMARVPGPKAMQECVTFSNRKYSRLNILNNQYFQLI